MTKNTQLDQLVSNRGVGSFFHRAISVSTSFLFSGEARPDSTSGAVVRPQSPDKGSESHVEDGGALPDIDKYRYLVMFCRCSCV